MSQPPESHSLEITTSLLSLEQKQIISKNPISSVLDAFRASLPKKFDNFDNFDNYIASAHTNDDAALLFHHLILQLAYSPSAKILIPPNSHARWRVSRSMTRSASLS